MSREEGIQIASRALALITAVSAVSTLTYLPDALVPLVHHLLTRGALVGQDYWTGYYVAITFSHVVRFLGLSLAALWFWKCGPGVRSALFPAHD